jgi:hypothetical protein
MKRILLLLCLAATARAGDNQRDFINYAPPVPPTEKVMVIAHDSARYEPRWQPMLDDHDLKRLIFIQAHNRETVIVHE